LVAGGGLIAARYHQGVSGSHHGNRGIDLQGFSGAGSHHSTRHLFAFRAGGAAAGAANDMTALKHFRFVCAACGEREWTAVLFAKGDDPDGWVGQPSPLFG